MGVKVFLVVLLMFTIAFAFSEGFRIRLSYILPFYTYKKSEAGETQGTPAPKPGEEGYTWTGN